MTAHFRNCPKHRKPLPCSHCAVIAVPSAHDEQVTFSVLQDEWMEHNAAVSGFVFKPGVDPLIAR